MRAYKKTASVTTNNDSKTQHNNIDPSIKGTIRSRDFQNKISNHHIFPKVSF